MSLEEIITLFILNFFTINSISSILPKILLFSIIPVLIFSLILFLLSIKPATLTPSTPGFLKVFAIRLPSSFNPTIKMFIFIHFFLKYHNISLLIIFLLIINSIIKIIAE